MVLPAIADRARARARTPRSISSSAAGTWRSPARSRRSPGRDARRRAGSRAAPPAWACAALLRARAVVAAAPLRPRHQLRAGHPQQPAARGLRRGVHRRLRRAAAAARCSTGRSTTTRARTRPTTRGALVAAVFGRPPRRHGRAAADDSRGGAARGGRAPAAGAERTAGRRARQRRPRDQAVDARAVRRGRAPPVARPAARRSC